MLYRLQAELVPLSFVILDHYCPNVTPIVSVGCSHLIPDL
jgi:hypothetical protein